MNAVTFILEHEQDPKKYLEATIDLSFASKDWQRTVLVRRRRRDWFIRQHLETCVFSYVAAELKTGDLCVRGSEQFADYRDQLLSWAECEPKVAEYCQQLGFPSDAEVFVEYLKRWLTEVSLEVDRARPENHELIITEKGEPALRKLPRKTPPKGLARLEAAVKARMKEVHLLDILCRTDQRLNWSSHFGPLSGADPKMKEARAHHILTVFAYASNLGPYQLARHLRGEVDGETLARLNRRHVTTEKLEAALRDVINRFNRCTLPRCWGTGKRAAADGTQYDLAEENLLAEQHIRYGGFGGITIWESIRRNNQLWEMHERVTRAELRRERAERVKVERILALNEALAGSQQARPHARIVAFGHYQIRDSDGIYYNVYHRAVGEHQAFECECPQYQRMAICPHSLVATALHSASDDPQY